MGDRIEHWVALAYKPSEEPFGGNTDQLSKDGSEQETEEEDAAIKENRWCVPWEKRRGGVDILCDSVTRDTVCKPVQGKLHRALKREDQKVTGSFTNFRNLGVYA